MMSNFSFQATAVFPEKSNNWIRSRVWDSCWILSGIPLATLCYGISLLTGGPRALLLFVFLLNMGHNCSPILLAWSHSSFRKMMLNEKTKYIFIPFSYIVASILLSFLAWKGLTSFQVPSFQGSNSMNNINSLLVIFWVFTIWNAWHFAGQSFGILSIYRQKARIYPAEQRFYDRAFALCIFVFLIPLAWYLNEHVAFRGFLPFLPTLDRRTVEVLTGFNFCAVLVLGAIMIQREIKTKILCLPRLIFIFTQCLMPLAFFWNHYVGFTLFGGSHWLASIGLTAHILSVHKKTTLPELKWYYCFGAISVGLIILSAAIYWIMALSQRVDFSNESYILSKIPFLLILAFGLRFGISFCHFHYERKLYQFSDTFVRQTIGRDLMSGA